MKATTVFIVVSLVFLHSAVIGREWTDSTGRYRVEAEFVEELDGNVRLKRRDGTVVEVPLGRLSQADREWVEAERRRRSTPAAPALNGRITSSLRGWLPEGERWLAITVPLSACPRKFTLNQCELRQGDSVVAAAIGIVPPADSAGSIAGSLRVARENTPLRIAPHQLRPEHPLEDPSQGVMQLALREETPFPSVSLYRFRVENLLVVGQGATLEVDRSAVLIRPASEITILSQHGWKVGLAANSQHRIRFQSKADATLDILFAVDGQNVRGLTLRIGDASIRPVTIVGAARPRKLEPERQLIELYCAARAAS
jgi:hypothetical protein